MAEAVVGRLLELRSRIVSPALQAVVDHWQRVRADNPMPAWSDLSPSALSSHLRRLWAFKFDRVTGDFTGRLANDSAMVGFRKSFRGTPLQDLHPPHVFEWVHAEMTKVVSEPSVYRSSGKLFKIGDTVVEGERVMLPLATDGIHGDGVIGVSDFQYPAIAGPIELLNDRVEWASILPTPFGERSGHRA